MLDWIRESTQGWLVKVILALIIVPFALFGIGSYFNHRDSVTTLATVNGDKINQTEFDEAIKEQRAALAASMGASFDPAVLEDPKIRLSILDGLIKQRLLISAAHTAGMSISDTRLAKFIAAIPAFQVNNQFSVNRYEQLLRQKGMTIAGFEQRARQDLLINDMRATFAQSRVIPASVVKTFMQALDQQREISLFTITPDAYVSQVKVTPVQIKAYYDNHQADYTVPAQARFQYAVLSLDAIAQQIHIDPAAIQQYYQQNLAQYNEPEQRQARHILIAVAKTATAQQRALAEARATHFYQLVSANPGSFAALAKQYSNDPGSATQGGDMGWFGRDAMVKPFADAVFGMKKNQIVGPVATDFGYHIIQLTGIKPARNRSLAEVTAEITNVLQKQQAVKLFADAAERFSNQVFEQSGELKPIAAALNIPLATSDWVSRNGGASGVFNSSKLLQALFSDDVLKHKRNSEAIEVTPNTLVSGRLLDYKAAYVQPLATVSVSITQRLQQQQARILAQNQGAALLAQLRAGKEPAGVHWGAFQWVTRSQTNNIAADLVEGIFAVDQKKMPGYLGAADSNGNYQLVRVTQVITPEVTDPLRLKSMQVQLANVVAEQAFSDYLAGLAAEAKIDIKSTALDKQSQ